MHHLEQQREHLNHLRELLQLLQLGFRENLKFRVRGLPRLVPWCSFIFNVYAANSNGLFGLILLDLLDVALDCQAQGRFWIDIKGKGLV